MNKKILTSTVMLSMVLLFTSCGSSSDSSTNLSDSSSNSIVNNGRSLKNEAAQVNRASANQQFNNESKSASGQIGKLQIKSQRKSSDDGVYECITSGSFELFTDENGSVTYVYDQCVYPDSGKQYYENGIQTYVESGDTKGIGYFNYSYTSDFENATSPEEYYEEFIIAYEGESFYFNGVTYAYKDGEVSEKFLYEDFIYVETENSLSFSINGKYTYTAKCFTENYEYKTSEDEADWLVPNSSNSDYYNSGTIVINGLKYVYDNTNVTLSKDGKSETYTQKEILEYVDSVTSNNSCSNINNLTISKSSSHLNTKFMKSSFSNLLNDTSSVLIRNKLMPSK